jgi:hypothetical protein
MIIGRTSPRGGSVTILAPAAHAAAAAHAPEIIVEPAPVDPPRPPDRWERVHRAGSIASIIGLVIEVVRMLSFKRQPADSAP